MCPNSNAYSILLHLTNNRTFDETHYSLQYLNVQLENSSNEDTINLFNRNWISENTAKPHNAYTKNHSLLGAVVLFIAFYKLKILNTRRATEYIRKYFHVLRNITFQWQDSLHNVYIPLFGRFFSYLPDEPNVCAFLICQRRRLFFRWRLKGDATDC